MSLLALKRQVPRNLEGGEGGQHPLGSQLVEYPNALRSAHVPGILLTLLVIRVQGTQVGSIAKRLRRAINLESSRHRTHAGNHVKPREEIKSSALFPRSNQINQINQIERRFKTLKRLRLDSRKSNSWGPGGQRHVRVLEQLARPSQSAFVQQARRPPTTALRLAPASASRG